MPDFNLPTLTTARVGIASTSFFLIQSISAYSVEVTNGTISIGSTTGLDFGITNTTRTGWLTGRRPVLGQLYPRFTK